MVLEGGNQVTPGLNSKDVVLDSPAQYPKWSARLKALPNNNNSPAQYVPEMFNTIHVTGHGRPGHHPDPVLLEELLHNSSRMWCGIVLLEDEPVESTILSQERK